MFGIAYVAIHYDVKHSKSVLYNVNIDVTIVCKLIHFFLCNSKVLVVPLVFPLCTICGASGTVFSTFVNLFYLKIPSITITPATCQICISPCSYRDLTQQRARYTWRLLLNKLRLVTHLLPLRDRKWQSGRTYCYLRTSCYQDRNFK